MDSAQWAELLGECLDHMFLEGTNVCKIRVWLHQGGIFKETRRLIVIDDGVHFEGMDWIACAKWGQSND
jgi:hypothetical protein